MGKISVEFLKLLVIVDAQLSQVKGKPDTDTAVFDRLVIVILMGDFYKFFILVRRPFYEKAITTDKLHSKAI